MEVAVTKTNPPDPIPEVVYTPQIEDLVAVAAAVASNCETCLDHHVAKARGLGLADTVIRQAVDTAIMVKNTPARAVRRQAETLLAPAADPTPAEPAEAPRTGGCCSGSAASTSGQPASGGCC
jgi:AhpD family alkylhydroperoxidase